MNNISLPPDLFTVQSSDPFGANCEIFALFYIHANIPSWRADAVLKLKHERLTLGFARLSQ